MESIINDIDMRLDAAYAALERARLDIDRLQELRRFAQIENDLAEVGRDTIAIQTGRRPL